MATRFQRPPPYFWGPVTRWDCCVILFDQLDLLLYVIEFENSFPIRWPRNIREKETIVCALYLYSLQLSMQMVDSYLQGNEENFFDQLDLLLYVCKIWKFESKLGRFLATLFTMGVSGKRFATGWPRNILASDSNVRTLFAPWAIDDLDDNFEGNTKKFGNHFYDGPQWPPAGLRMARRGGHNIVETIHNKVKLIFRFWIWKNQVPLYGQNFFYSRYRVSMRHHH